MLGGDDDALDQHVAGLLEGAGQGMGIWTTRSLHRHLVVDERFGGVSFRRVTTAVRRAELRRGQRSAYVPSPAYPALADALAWLPEGAEVEVMAEHFECFEGKGPLILDRAISILGPPDRSATLQVPDGILVAAGSGVLISGFRLRGGRDGPVVSVHGEVTIVYCDISGPGVGISVSDLGEARVHIGQNLLHGCAIGVQVAGLPGAGLVLEHNRVEDNTSGVEFTGLTLPLGKNESLTAAAQTHFARNEVDVQLCGLAVSDSAGVHVALDHCSLELRRWPGPSSAVIEMAGCWFVVRVEGTFIDVSPNVVSLNAGDTTVPVLRMNSDSDSDSSTVASPVQPMRRPSLSDVGRQVGEAGTSFFELLFTPRGTRAQ